MYEPRTGRFTSEDPICSGLNWYTYCGNNPIRFIDPSGCSFDSFNGAVDWALEMGFSKYDAFMFACDFHTPLDSQSSIVTYKDDKDSSHSLDWQITNEMFTDSNSLTQRQITEILMAHNPTLVELGYDIAIYNACQERGLNPKIILATLATEQDWGRNGKYDKLFGVGPAGRPNSFGAESFGGLYAAVNTYIKWYEEGLKMSFPSSMVVNQDAKLVDYTSGYVSRNPNSRSYITNGQNVDIVNAAMYARIKYNQWLYHPQIEQDGLSYGVSGRGHLTARWQSLALSF